MKEWSRSHGYALTYLNISLSHWINTACCCCSFEPIHLLPPSHLTEPLEGHKVQVQCTQSHRAASIVEVIVGGNVCSTPLSQRLSGQAKVKEEGLFYFVSTWQRLSGFCQSNFHVFHTPRASIILSLHSIPAASSVGKTPNWNYEYFEHNRRGSAKLSSAGTCTIGAEISHASHDSPQLWWEHGAEGALC